MVSLFLPAFSVSIRTALPLSKRTDPHIMNDGPGASISMSCPRSSRTIILCRSSSPSHVTNSFVINRSMFEVPAPPSWGRVVAMLISECRRGEEAGDDTPLLQGSTGLRRLLENLADAVAHFHTDAGIELIIVLLQEGRLSH